tara:strand:- start:720 stop:893 length:174 start_codon:yes stop_codon:yes gene_type:complete
MEPLMKYYFNDHYSHFEKERAEAEALQKAAKMHGRFDSKKHNATCAKNRKNRKKKNK